MAHLSYTTCRALLIYLARSIHFKQVTSSVFILVEEKDVISALDKEVGAGVAEVSAKCIFLCKYIPTEEK